MGMVGECDELDVLGQLQPGQRCHCARAVLLDAHPDADT